MRLTRINDVGRAEEQHLRMERESQEKEEALYELPSLYFRLIAKLTNKSDDKICILVTLLSPLLDPASESTAPFMSHPTSTIHSHSRRLSSHHFSLFLLLPLPNPESRFWPRVFQPFPSKHGGRRLNRHERSMESSLMRLKSHESYRSAEKHIDRIRKRLDRSKDAFCRQKLNYNVYVSKI